MTAVFDTNIIIDALNGLREADEEYSRYTRVLISRVTWMEVLAGVGEEDAQIRDFLETCFEIVPIDLEVAEKAVTLRRQHHMRLPDAIIWATAQTNNALLVSRNTRDFNPEWPGVRAPYKV